MHELKHVVKMSKTFNNTCKDSHDSFQSATSTPAIHDGISSIALSTFIISMDGSVWKDLMSKTY